MPGTKPTPVMYSDIVDETVTQQFMRGEWENTKEVNALLERLDKKGRINFDASGKYVDLIARVGRWQGERRADLANRNFNRKQHRVTYTFPYSFVEIPGILSERDVMFMRSKDARVRIQDQMLTEMGEDFKLDINNRIFTENSGSNTVAGQASYAGSDVPMYGLPSIFGYGSSAQDWDPDAQTTSGAVGASDKEVLPNTTYGGVSTDPSTALTGVDDPVNEATSPVIANWSSTAWTGTATWASTCTDVLTHMIVRQTRSNMPSDRPDIGFMPQSNYIDFKNTLKDGVNQQVVIAETPTAPDAGMYPRLFINYEGVVFYYDLDCPTGAIFLLNSNYLWVKVYPQEPAGNKGGAIKGRTSEMFSVAQMPDIDQGGHKVVSTFVAQVIANPRFHGMAYNFA